MDEQLKQFLETAIPRLGSDDIGQDEVESLYLQARSFDTLNRIFQSEDWINILDSYQRGLIGVNELRVQLFTACKTGFINQQKEGSSEILPPQLRGSRVLGPEEVARFQSQYHLSRQRVEESFKTSPGGIPYAFAQRLVSAYVVNLDRFYILSAQDRFNAKQDALAQIRREFKSGTIRSADDVERVLVASAQKTQEAVVLKPKSDEVGVVFTQIPSFIDIAKTTKPAQEARDEVNIHLSKFTREQLVSNEIAYEATAVLLGDRDLFLSPQMIDNAINLYTAAAGLAGNARVADKILQNPKALLTESVITSSPLDPGGPRGVRATNQEIRSMARAMYQGVNSITSSLSEAGVQTGALQFLTQKILESTDHSRKTGSAAVGISNFFQEAWGTVFSAAPQIQEGAFLPFILTTSSGRQLYFSKLPSGPIRPPTTGEEFLLFIAALSSQNQEQFRAVGSSIASRAPDYYDTLLQNMFQAGVANASWKNELIQEVYVRLALVQHIQTHGFLPRGIHIDWTHAGEGGVEIIKLIFHTGEGVGASVIPRGIGSFISKIGSGGLLKLGATAIGGVATGGAGLIAGALGGLLSGAFREGGEAVATGKTGRNMEILVIAGIVIVLPVVMIMGPGSTIITEGTKKAAYVTSVGGGYAEGQAPNCQTNPNDPLCNQQACDPTTSPDGCLWPVSGYITQGPYNNCGESHTTMNAVDIAAPIGTNVIATKPGVVTVVYNECGDVAPGDPNPYKKCGGEYGNHIYIQTDEGYELRFGHLSYNSITVSGGQRVETGQVIAQVDNNGYSTGSHLHYEMRGSANINSILPSTVPACGDPVDGCVACPSERVGG